MLSLHYKLYSFYFGRDLGLGLEAMALALVVLALLTSLQILSTVICYFTHLTASSESTYWIGLILINGFMFSLYIFLIFVSWSCGRLSFTASFRAHVNIDVIIVVMTNHRQTCAVV